MFIQFRPTSNNFKSRNKLPLINVSEEDMEPEFEYCMKELTTFSSNLGQIITRLEKLVNEENGMLWFYCIMVCFIINFIVEMAICWMNLSSSWVSYGGIERNPGLFM